MPGSSSSTLVDFIVPPPFCMLEPRRRRPLSIRPQEWFIELGNSRYSRVAHPLGTKLAAATRRAPQMPPNHNHSLESEDFLWYQDAVIYEVHVRAFYDANDDGMGDFAGLTQKLDYLQDLGVTAIWILPFCPSPWRDDGYD